VSNSYPNSPLAKVGFFTDQLAETSLLISIVVK